MTQPPYGPPNQPQYPPGYQPPPHGYPQPPPASYPPGYGPAYGYQPAYAPPGHQQPTPPRRRRLLWTWIGFLGAAIPAFALFAALAVQWGLAADRVGQPDNTSATYGTVLATQGADLQVHVADGTALVKRADTHIFNRTSKNTSTTQVDGGFIATVSGAPSLAVGSLVSFTYTNDETQGTYLAVAPSRIKAAGSLPVAMVTSFVAGFVLGVVGVILLIVWLVKWRRNRRPAVPMYSAPPSYWPPNPPRP